MIIKILAPIIAILITSTSGLIYAIRESNEQIFPIKNAQIYHQENVYQTDEMERCKLPLMMGFPKLSVEVSEQMLIKSPPKMPLIEHYNVKWSILRLSPKC